MLYVWQIQWYFGQIQWYFEQIPWYFEQLQWYFLAKTVVLGKYSGIWDKYCAIEGNTVVFWTNTV